MLTVKVSPPRTCDDDSGSRISPGSSTSSRSKHCAVLSLLPLEQEMPFPVVWPDEGKFLNGLHVCLYISNEPISEVTRIRMKSFHERHGEVFSVLLMKSTIRFLGLGYGFKCQCSFRHIFRLNGRILSRCLRFSCS